jgi:hypothetical protein
VASLRAVFQILNDIKDDGVVEDYAVGGAMAVLFYAEPTRTYDVDVFVLLPESGQQVVLLTPVYSWLEERGFKSKAEHVLVHGVPVQILPAYNDLVEDAVIHARLLDYEGVPVRVSSPEHLIALAFQAGGRRRRERAFQLLETCEVDRGLLATLLERHEIAAEGLTDD